MVHQSTTGAASTAPTFDPRAWLESWQAIGGGFARTDAGLFLFWDAVDDTRSRNRLHGQVGTPGATAALIEHLDAQRVGGC